MNRGRLPAAALSTVALSELGAHGPAFLALAHGDSVLDPYLPPLRRLETAVKERRSHLDIAGRDSLWAAVDAAAVRCSAHPASRSNIDALRRGAPAVFTGQQPGLFGGPLFTLYKAATAVVLARHLSERLGEPVASLFWVASDDSDFDEIASATVAGPDLALRTIELDPALREPERMVGHLPVEAGRLVSGSLVDGPGAARARELAGLIWEQGRDWGEGFAACLYALLGEQGLVVVDAREPVLRDLARPLLDRVLEDVAGFTASVDSAGEALARSPIGRQLGEFAAAFPFWREEPPWRRRVAGIAAGMVARTGAESGETAVVDDVPPSMLAAEARRVLRGDVPGSLWPGVALRPLVVDALLPTVARVMGPAEIAYQAQLAPAYARLGISMPAAVPRLTATLMPPQAVRVAQEADCELSQLLTHWGPTLESIYRRRLPPAVSEALAGLEAAEQGAFARARAALADFGPGLEQLVDSVAGKADFQRQRLWEAATKRGKLRAEAEIPELRHLRAFLRPDQGLQERRLSVLSGIVRAGEALVPAVLQRAEEHLAALASGRPVHHLIGFET